MEFSFNLNKYFDKSICKIEGNYLYKNKNNPKFKNICMVINLMGESSSKAQNLPNIITTADKIILGNHIYYLKFKDNFAIGYIKVGIKKLFYRDYHGRIKELQPISILDFYVSEKLQRSGHGKDLFEYFLKDVNIKPSKIAIDRPSFLFLNFLKKNYDLKNYIPQSNNFVIFDKYFQNSNISNLNIKTFNSNQKISTLHPKVKNYSSNLEFKIQQKEKELEQIKEKLKKKNIYQTLPQINSKVYNPITHTVFTNNNNHINNRNKISNKTNNFYSRTNNIYNMYSANQISKQRKFFFK